MVTNKSVIDLPAIDFLHLIDHGHYRLVPFNKAIEHVVKAAGRLPAWWPNAVLLRSILKKAWKKRGRFYNNIILNAFDFKDDGSVRTQDLKEAKKVGRAAGKLMWKDIEEGVQVILDETIKRGMRAFEKEHIRKAEAAQDYATDWKAILAERHQKHVKVFVEKFPERTLHPEIERLADIIGKDSKTRGIDLDTIQDRLHRATNGARYWDDMGTVNVSRLWSGESIVLAHETGSKSYRVQAVLDENTCPICVRIHGRTFQVKDAFDRYQEFLNLEDPSTESITQLYPFVRSAEIDNESPEAVADLGARGMPPYHPRCRCQVIFTGIKGHELITPETAPQILQRAQLPLEILEPVVGDVTIPAGYSVNKDTGFLMPQEAAAQLTRAEAKASMEGLVADTVNIPDDVEKAIFNEANDTLKLLNKHAPLKENLKRFNFFLPEGEAGALDAGLFSYKGDEIWIRSTLKLDEINYSNHASAALKAKKEAGDKLLKEIKALDKKMKGGKIKDYTKYIEKRTALRNSLDDLIAAQNQLLADFNSGKALPSLQSSMLATPEMKNELVGSITHEYGHAWHWQNQAKVEVHLDLKWGEVKKPLLKKLANTSYGMTNAQECFAENFMQYVAGDVTTMNPKFVRFFDREFPTLNFGGTHKAGVKLHLPKHKPLRDKLGSWWEMNPKEYATPKPIPNPAGKE